MEPATTRRGVHGSAGSKENRWTAFLKRKLDKLAPVKSGEPSFSTNSFFVLLVAGWHELRPLGIFAAWQAERVIGDHDRNTLRLRLDLDGQPAGLEPGMTVWVEN